MKRKNMNGKYMVAIMAATGIVLGIVISAGIGIGLLHISQKEQQQAISEKENMDMATLQEDPLWVLSEEKVALSATPDIQDEVPGFVYMDQQVQIAVDCPAEEIIAKLGEPVSVQEAGNSLYGSLDKHYQYDGFEVSTYQLGDMDYISAVFIDNEDSATPEGIRVSMTKEDMEAAYGMEYVEEDDICTYEKDGKGLEFMIDDGKIAYIQYLSSNYM